jgi:hypothetical protein
MEETSDVLAYLAENSLYRELIDAGPAGRRHDNSSQPR